MKNDLFRLFLLLTVAHIQGVYSDAYEKGKCYCATEMDSFLETKLPVEPRPDAPFHNYTGVKVVTENKFTTCVCDDVYRVLTPFVFDDQVAFASSKSVTGQNDMKTLIEGKIEYYNQNPKTLLYTDVQYKSTDVSENTIFSFEFFLKGHPDTMPDFLTTLINSVTQNITQEFANVDKDKIDIKARECTGSPLDADPNGVRKMTTSFPGARVTYGCNDNYVLMDPESAFSVCSHETLTWVPPTESIKCIAGCTVEPPKPPLFSIMQWDDIMRKDGDEVKYVCMYGFKPLHLDLTSTSSKCENNAWTSYSADFECEQITCPRDIPQNIDHGLVERFQPIQDHFIGHTLYYSCIEKFCSTYDYPIVVRCLKNGEWSPLPNDYKCFPKTTTICMTSVQRRTLEDQRYKPESVYLTENLFFLVTIPGIIGLGLLLCCALVLVHSNSPLYRCCNESTKRQRYAY